MSHAGAHPPWWRRMSSDVSYVVKVIALFLGVLIVKYVVVPVVLGGCWRAIRRMLGLPSPNSVIMRPAGGDTTSSASVRPQSMGIFWRASPGPRQGWGRRRRGVSVLWRDAGLLDARRRAVRPACRSHRWCAASAARGSEW